MTMTYQKRVCYFKGERVMLNGSVTTLYGGLFYEGVYLTGLREGECVHVHNDIVCGQPVILLDTLTT